METGRQVRKPVPNLAGNDSGWAAAEAVDWVEGGRLWIYFKGTASRISLWIWCEVGEKDMNDGIKVLAKYLSKFGRMENQVGGKSGV